jgi:SAM-dependent methyltransferase
MEDMRKIVERGYEEGDYLKTYRLDENINEYPFEKRNLDRLMKLLPKKARILDLGCGPGIPYDKYLVKKGFQLIGVEISRKHVSLARKNVPDAIFIRGDMSTVNFKEKSFDAVVSFYAIFHVPKEEHKNPFLKIQPSVEGRWVDTSDDGC